jgi:hypothetical protein
MVFQAAINVWHDQALQDRSYSSELEDFACHNPIFGLRKALEYPAVSHKGGCFFVPFKQAKFLVGDAFKPFTTSYTRDAGRRE